jgi:hypothetical protein
MFFKKTKKKNIKIKKDPGKVIIGYYGAAPPTQFGRVIVGSYETEALNVNPNIILS